MRECCSHRRPRLQREGSSLTRCRTTAGLVEAVTKLLHARRSMLRCRAIAKQDNAVSKCVVACPCRHKSPLLRPEVRLSRSLGSGLGGRLVLFSKEQAQESGFVHQMNPH